MGDQEEKVKMIENFVAQFAKKKDAEAIKNYLEKQGTGGKEEEQKEKGENGHANEDPSQPIPMIHSMAADEADEQFANVEKIQNSFPFWKFIESS